ncbi:hypothetical protein Dimus_019964, partial [Dionaea muscipula]
LCERLRVLKGMLRDLHKCHFSGIEARIQAARDRLTRVQHELRAWFSDEGVLIVGRVVAEYWELIIVEERILK